MGEKENRFTVSMLLNMNKLRRQGLALLNFNLNPNFFSFSLSTEHTQTTSTYYYFPPITYVTFNNSTPKPLNIWKK